MPLSLLDAVAQADSFPYNISAAHELYTLVTHDGTAQLGRVLPSAVRILTAHLASAAFFVVDPATRRIALAPDLDTFEKRSRAFAEVTASWRAAGTFALLSGWRNELYTVYAPAHVGYLAVERSACPIFGFVTYGVHLTAYVPTAMGLRLWVPRRSRTKATYPGMLDNTVAGGIAHGYGVFETLVKECGEEAGFPEKLIREHAVAVGAVSYLYVRQKTAGGETGFIQPEVQYLYDLKMPEDALPPEPVDGEAEEFNLWDVDKVLSEIAAGHFKPNTALVTIEFLIRHGVITPENEPDYVEILARMHRHLELPLQ
ncbi:NUDIX hydrolase domain-like protein [Limtongia smithiae]|uniref:NUDIX hydrolase domain-like protein n=1 Tax=Limtongia smithiae TaxID=1125753 RepID=UPI0034CDCABD